MAHVLLIVFWLTFYLSHSILASWPLKRYIRSRWAGFLDYYRITYNLISAVGLLGIYWYQKSLAPYTLFLSTGLGKFTGYILLATGLLIMLLAMSRYSAREFLGFRKEGELVGSPPPLNTQGLNAWVRHPLYFGVLLFGLGLFLQAPLAQNLIFLLVTSAYLILSIPWEEQKLGKLYGPAYQDYQKNTPMLIPFLF